MTVTKCHPNRKHCAKGLCSPCYQMLHKSKHPEKIAYWRKMTYNATCKARYGLSLEAIEKLKQSQAGRCAICQSADKRLVVDHDHSTGKVRALLCDSCNTICGLWETKPATVIAAKQYLLIKGGKDDRYRPVEKEGVAGVQP